MAGVDLVVLVLLALFALWGAWRGLLRQALATAVIIGALVVATVFGHALEPAVEKVATVGPQERAALAFASMLFFALVVGGILLALLKPVTDRAPHLGPVGRGIGSLLGVAIGALLITVVAYTAMAVTTTDDVASESATTDPVLMRGTGGGTERLPAPTGQSRLAAACQDSRLATWLPRAGRLLRESVGLPAWISAWLRAVDADLLRKR